MLKHEIINLLIKNKIAAVIREKTADDGINRAIASINGGINSIEVAFTTPNANEIIKELVKKYDSNDDILIGAGTILDPISARIAILEGAKFIVAPTFNQEVAKICNLYQIPYIPGCMTIDEVTTALEYGSDIVKVFPGKSLGISFVKSIKGPLPQATLMPSGGVNLENAKEWLNNGASLISVGGELIDKKDPSFERTSTLAKEFIDLIK